MRARPLFARWLPTLTWLTLIGPLSAAEPVLRWERPTSPVPCYDFAEITLRVDQPTAPNPFTDVRLTGEFQREGQPPVPVTGFCDARDGTVYRIRFMPNEPGVYRYVVTFTQGDRVRTETGTFESVAGSNPGPVRVDPAHPFHFVREGTGAHWFWMGTTTYQLLAFDEATIAASVNRLADLGVNRLRVALSGRTKDGMRWNEPLVVRSDKFAFQMEPWIAARSHDLENPGFDVTRFNVEFFQKTERMLRLARDRDVIVSIIFYVDGRDAGVDPFGKEGMGGPDERRYYEYVAARLSPFSNIMWDVTNEYHLFRDEAWVNAMGTYLKACDPYDHIASVHGHGKFPFRESPWADFALYQSWDEHGGYAFMLRNRKTQQDLGRPFPQINEEYGYEDHYPYPWGEGRVWPTRTAETRRRLAWEMTMAGCYQTTGERANTGTGAGRDTGGGWVNGRGDETMTMLRGYRHIRTFFEGLSWWELEPRPDLVALPEEPPRPAPPKDRHAPPIIRLLHPHPTLLATEGSVYVAYLPQGGEVTLDLAPGNYRGRWFNPRTGIFVEGGCAAVGGRWRSPAAPDAEDWVLLLVLE